MEFKLVLFRFPDVTATGTVGATVTVTSGATETVDVNSL